MGMPDSKKTPQINAMEKPILLLVDDDPIVIETTSFLLKKHYRVISASSRSEIKQHLMSEKISPSLALIDLGLPPVPHSPEEGFALITDLLACNSDMRILILSGQDRDTNVQHALTLGAADFIAKPSDPEDLLERLNYQFRLTQGSSTENKETTTISLVGSSVAMQTLQQQIDLYANTPFPVLVEGESGTGKELIAQSLHDKSSRSSKPFLALNCAAFTHELLDAQLFGYRKGAFTGATSDHAGFFEAAEDGTLFLDEIGEMPVELQSKLLRILENGGFYRIGETQPRTTQARVIAATNRKLPSLVSQKLFREDLFHRLSVLTINSPPLSSRGDDKLELLDFFQSTLNTSIAPFTLDVQAQKKWLEYTFPGNVRELRNIVIRLGVKFPGQTINLSQLTEEFDPGEEPAVLQSLTSSPETDQIAQRMIREGVCLDDILHETERSYILKAIELSKGNLSQAARFLKTSRTTLYGKMQRLGINPQQE